MKHFARITLFLTVLIVAAACRQQVLSIENINLDVAVTGSLVGETTLVVTVTDDEGNAIENPGTLSIRGDMDHAGMTPVIRDVSESTNGVFTVPFEWTMGGAWTLEVKLSLENGEVATETFDYEILTEAGDDMDDMDHSDMDMDSTEEHDTMDGMDHSDMDMDSTEEHDTMDGMDHSDMDMDSTEEHDTMDGMDHSDMDMGDDNMSGMDHGSGETSAVYMTITNNSDEDVTIVSAETEAAGLVEIHETTIENDVARMSPIEEVMIEAGETVEFRPAGLHIMLMDLQEDIIADSQLTITLNFEDGDQAIVSARVIDMLMDDLDDEVEVGDLTVKNVWARPAFAG